MARLAKKVLHTDGVGGSAVAARQLRDAHVPVDQQPPQTIAQSWFN